MQTVRSTAGRPHYWEQYRFPDSQSGERHQQPIDSHTGSGCRWHPVFHRGEEVFIQNHCFVITGGGEPCLIDEPFALDDRIDQL